MDVKLIDNIRRDARLPHKTIVWSLSARKVHPDELEAGIEGVLVIQRGIWQGNVTAVIIDARSSRTVRSTKLRPQLARK